MLRKTTMQEKEPSSVLVASMRPQRNAAENVDAHPPRQGHHEGFNEAAA